MTHNTPDDKNPAYVLQCAHVEILCAAAKGEIDLNQLARAELANRGLNWKGTWVGFDRAAALAADRLITTIKGRRVRVSVPEDPNDCAECGRSYGPHYTGACYH